MIADIKVHDWVHQRQVLDFDSNELGPLLTLCLVPNMTL